MKFLGNILWLVFGGIVIAIIYYIVGLMMCITIIGIPLGIQCFKIAGVAMFESHLDPLRLVGDCHFALYLWPSFLLNDCGNSLGPATLQDGHCDCVSVW